VTGGSGSPGGTADALVGTWTRIEGEPCASPYPDELELRPGGRYVGRKREGAREHPRWDVGSYRLREDGRLAVSTATDAVLPYAFELRRDVLRFVDEHGCEIRYRRAP
jgi:hypothetical protein